MRLFKNFSQVEVSPILKFFSPFIPIVTKVTFHFSGNTSRHIGTKLCTNKLHTKTKLSSTIFWPRGHRLRSRSLQSSLSLARSSDLTVSLSYACNTSFESPLQGLTYCGWHAPPSCIHFKVIKGNMRNGTVFTQFFAYGFEVVKDNWHKPYIFWKSSLRATIYTLQLFSRL